MLLAIAAVHLLAQVPALLAVLLAESVWIGVQSDRKVLVAQEPGQ